MTLAADTRAAVRRRPFLYEALRAGLLNYAAAARLLDVDGERSAVVAALRRYGEALPEYDEHTRRARVTMQSGLGERSSHEDIDDTLLLRVGGHAFVPDAGTLTGVLATGDVDGTALSHVLGRLATEGIDPVAAGVAGEALVVVVSRQEGPTAVRALEGALDRVPD